eukprot:scaffold410533_cov18-Prasinocladus_malaysianus.AAC.2
MQTNFPDISQVPEAELTVGLVVAYCHKNISWIRPQVKDLAQAGFHVKSIHIYSKCNNPISDELLPPGAVVETLPNVGRCDHTYLYHLAQHPATALQSITIFAKDAAYRRPHASLKELVITAMHNNFGFACGQKPPTFQNKGGESFSVTNWYLSRRLKALSLRAYKSGSSPGSNSHFKAPKEHRGLGAWLRSVDAMQPETYRQLFSPPALPFCFGGIFAVRRKNAEIVKPEGWAKLEVALSRGDNIEEGHYMERLWALLFSKPPAHWQNWPNILEAMARKRGPVTTQGIIFVKCV